jgi:hypothetical protein
MAGDGMQVQRAMRLAAVQIDRYTSNRDVRHDQREDYDFPAAGTHQAIRQKVQYCIQNHSGSKVDGRDSVWSLSGHDPKLGLAAFIEFCSRFYALYVPIVEACRIKSTSYRHFLIWHHFFMQKRKRLYRLKAPLKRLKIKSIWIR